MTLLDKLNDASSEPGSDEGRFAVVIPAAGESSRFTGFTDKKPFVELSGRAIWLRTVDHFINRSDVSEVVLVLAEDDMAEFKERFRPNLAFMDVVVAKGGATRAESVRNGIAALTKDADFIAVHDAARPLLCKAWISEIFAAAIEHNAVIPGTRVSSTVKKVNEDGRIMETLDRSDLMLAQTPQVFSWDIITKAYAENPNPGGYTDEASLVEASGHPVFVHDAWPINIKITTQQDYQMAEALLRALPSDGGLQGLL